eukprot:1887465-Rhodomonas_salina.1
MHTLASPFQLCTCLPPPPPPPPPPPLALLPTFSPSSSYALPSTVAATPLQWHMQLHKTISVLEIVKSGVFFLLLPDHDSGLRVSVLGSWVLGLGSKVLGLGSRVWGLGSRV